MTKNQKNYNFSGNEALKVEIATLTFPYIYYTEVLNHYGEDLTTPKSSGAGLLIYSGMSNANGSIFVGGNSNKSSCILKFAGENAGEELQLFINDFQSGSPEEFKAALKLSGIEGLVRLEVPKNLQTSEDLRVVFEEACEVQVKKIPKIENLGNELRLGAKTGSGVIRVFGLIPKTKDPKVSIVNLIGMGLSFKFSDKNSREILELIQTNGSIPIENILFFYLKGQISRFTINGFLDKIRDVFLIGIGGMEIVYPHAKTANRIFSPSGKYVSKSLTGILNKLKDEATNAEAKEVILYWFTSVKKQLALVEGNSEFTSSLIKLLQTFPQPKAAPEPPSKKPGKENKNPPQDSGDSKA